MTPRSRWGEGRKKYLEIEDPAEHKQGLDVLTLFHSMKVGNLQVRVIAINPLVIIALDAIIFHFLTPNRAPRSLPSSILPSHLPQFCKHGPHYITTIPETIHTPSKLPTKI